MNVLQIGNVDTFGDKFNGTKLAVQLKKKGIKSHYLAWNKNTSNPDVSEMFHFRGKQRLKGIIDRIERHFSIQSVLYPFSFFLPFKKIFKHSDIIHYHLIHTGFFSLYSLPFLSKIKPAVWSLHDPWALTGHCIYPFDCQKWLLGCNNCQLLYTPLSLKSDNTRRMWNIKKKIYNRSKIDIVVASKFMFDMVQKSPLFNKQRIHHIPYGIDLNIYKPSNVEKAKIEFGINPENIVLTFRSTKNIYKGFSFVVDFLRSYDSKIPISIISFDTKGLLKEFENKFQIIDLGWVSDDNYISQAYNASDIFLMPSIQEAFGLMAIEAMACSKPVIVFDGTSLPEVIFYGKGGIVVPQGNSSSFNDAILDLIYNSEKRELLGRQALELTKKHYDQKLYLSRLINLYNDILDRNKI